ncbi:MAG: thiol:disulfide interchange protein DsbG [Rhodanobacter sp.]
MKRTGMGLALLLASTAGMATNTPATPAPAPNTPAEQHLVDSGSKILLRMPAVSGLTALVADNGKEQRLFYETSDGAHLIVGAIFDAQGHDVTTQDMQRLAAAPTAPEHATPNALFARASRLQWIADGHQGRVIYAIFDPNCPYCHGLYSALRPAVQAGKVQVRWIPVNLLAPSGAGMITSIYASSDPASALGEAFLHVLKPTAVTKASDLAMSYNLLLMRDTGHTGVPLLLYQQGNDTVVHEGALDAPGLAAIGAM